MNDGKQILQKALKAEARRPGGKRRYAFAVEGARGLITRGMMKRRFEMIARKASPISELRTPNPE